MIIDKNYMIVCAVFIILVLIAFYFYSRRENFENDTGNKLILFHVGWCGHCKRFKPIWDKFAKKINGMNSSVKCYSEDCEKNKNICNKYGITGYPTIKLIKANGDIVNYKGSRTEADLMEFLRNEIYI